jgi:hypothetical protein
MERIRILHVYKSFNVYNGLIEILTILLRDLDLTRYELAVAVYRYEGNEFGRAFERMGGRIISLDVPEGVIAEPAQYRPSLHLRIPRRAPRPGKRRQPAAVQGGFTAEQNGMMTPTAP